MMQSGSVGLGVQTSKNQGQNHIRKFVHVPPIEQVRYHSPQRHAGESQSSEIVPRLNSESHRLPKQSEDTDQKDKSIDKNEIYKKDSQNRRLLRQRRLKQMIEGESQNNELE